MTTKLDQRRGDEIDQGTGTLTTGRFSFSGWDDWLALDNMEHNRSVLHLHGLVYSETRTPEGPLVLSESDFTKHGPSIQKALSAICHDAHVVTIGASLNDRNITSALSDSSSSRTPPSVEDADETEAPDTSRHNASEVRSDRYSLVTPPLTKPGQNARHLSAREEIIGGDSHRALELSVSPHRAQRERLGPLFHFLRRFEQLVSRGGQREPSRSTIKQAHAQCRL